MSEKEHFLKRSARSWRGPRVAAAVIEDERSCDQRSKAASDRACQLIGETRSAIAERRLKHLGEQRLLDGHHRIVREVGGEHEREGEGEGDQDTLEHQRLAKCSGGLIQRLKVPLRGFLLGDQVPVNNDVEPRDVSTCGIADRHSDRAEMRLDLLPRECEAICPRFLQQNTQFVRISDRVLAVRMEAGVFQIGFQFVFWQVGEQRPADRCAVGW